MIAPNILPLLILTIFVLLACPILTTMFFYYRFELRTKSKNQKILVSFLCPVLTLIFMFILQKQFPFTIGIYFISYFIIISILTITEYRKQKKKTQLLEINI
jgi:hypothetical protein